MWTSDIQKRRGLILILSSPSGTGKSSLIQKIMTRDSDIRFSISVTTRPPRGPEQNGTAYTFVSEETFDALRQDPDYFIEHAMCYGYQYGTPKKPIEEMLQSGKDIVMDISWEGAKIFLETMPQDVVTVFVLPPSLEILKERLRQRGQDSLESIAHRMHMASQEIKHKIFYHYLLLNEDLDRTADQLYTILQSERMRTHRLLSRST